MIFHDGDRIAGTFRDLVPHIVMSGFVGIEPYLGFETGCRVSSVGEDRMSRKTGCWVSGVGEDRMSRRIGCWVSGRTL